MRSASGEHFKVCDRVMVRPGVYRDTSRTTVLLTKPTRGSLMETWGISQLRVQLDRGDAIYAHPYEVDHLGVIERLAEADRR